MAVEEYYTDEANEETAGNADRDKLVPGFYLFRTADAIESGEYITIDAETLQCSKPGMPLGQVHREFFSLAIDKASSNRRIAYQIAANLATKEQIKAARTAGQGLVIEYTSSVGQCWVAEIAPKQVKKKDENGKDVWTDDPSGDTKIRYDHIFHVDDPVLKRKGFIIDKSKLEMSNAFGGDLPKTEPKKAGFF